MPHLTRSRRRANSARRAACAAKQAPVPRAVQLARHEQREAAYRRDYPVPPVYAERPPQSNRRTFRNTVRTRPEDLPWDLTAFFGSVFPQKFSRNGAA